MSTSPRSNGARTAANERLDDARDGTKVDKSPPIRPPRSLLFCFLPTAVVLSLVTLLAGLRATSLGIVPSTSAASRSSIAILDAMHTTAGPQAVVKAPERPADAHKEVKTPARGSNVEDIRSSASQLSVASEAGQEKRVGSESNEVPNGDVPSNSTSDGDEEFDNTPDDDEDDDVENGSDKHGDKDQRNSTEKIEADNEPHTFVALVQVMEITVRSCLKYNHATETCRKCSDVHIPAFSRVGAQWICEFLLLAAVA